MASGNTQIKITAVDAASAQLKSVADAASQSAKQLNNLGNSMSGMVFNGVGIAAGIAGFNGLANAVNSAASATLNFSKGMETNEIGIAGILTSMVSVKGRNLEWNEALSLSKSAMSQLNDEALKTAATSEELVTVYRSLLGPGLAAKMTMQEIVQLTSTGVNAVKSLGLNNVQLVQELRDLVQGGIQPASSTLATALGLKDSDIKAAKASAEGLYSFLMKRLDGFKIASEYTQNTWAGKMDQIKEGFTRIAGQGTIPLFDSAKDVLGTIANQILQIDKEAKTVQLNPELLSTLTEMSNKIINVASDLRVMALPMIDVVLPTIQSLGQGLEYVADHVKSVVATFGTMLILSKLAAVYTEITLVATGATAANTTLGFAVQRVRASLMEQALAGQLVAESNVVIAQATVAGNLEVIQSVNAINLAYKNSAISALMAAETMQKASALAVAGNMAQAKAVLATNVAYIEQQAIASSSFATAAAGAIRTNGVLQTLGRTLLALTGGWIGLAAVTAYATYELLNYWNEKNKVESYNRKAEVYEEGGKLYKKTWAEDGHMESDGLGGEIPVGPGWKKVELSAGEVEAHNFFKENGYAPDWETGRKPFVFNTPKFEDLNLKFPGAEKDTSKKEERAYEEKQKLIDKLADMTAKMEEKMVSETGTTFELNMKKLKDESANMQRDLDKNKIDFAKYGIDVSAVQTKITEYQEAMTAKYTKIQKQALDELFQVTAETNAKITGDTTKAAEAEYQTRLLTITKEKEERLKATGDKQAVLDWEVAMVKDAEAKKKLAIGEGALALKTTTWGQKNSEYNNRFMSDRQKEVNDLNKDTDEIAAKYSGFGELFSRAADGTLTIQADTFSKLAGISAAAKKDIEDHVNYVNNRTKNLNNNPMGSFAEGLKLAAKDYGDWSSNMIEVGKSTAQAMQGSFQSFFFDAFTGQLKSFGDYLGSFFKSVSNAISNMMANQMAAKVVNMFFPAKADGGPTIGGQTYLVGEHGPELFRSNSAGNITPTTKLNTSGGTPNMIVNVYNNSGQQVDAKQTDIHFDGESYVLGVVMNGISKNKMGMRDLLRG